MKGIVKMNLEIYQEVALKKNLSKTKFKKGDLCTVLSVKEEGKKEMIEIEFFSILGQSLGVYTVSSDYVQVLSPTAVANMREL
jgi:hypothetical protein